MLTEQPILITSIKCNQPTGITKYRFVSFGGTWGSEGNKSLGVCNADTSQNEEMPVTAKGIALVITGGGIPLGSAVQAFDEGVAAVQDAGPTEGYALDAATGAGQLIRVLLV